MDTRLRWTLREILGEETIRSVEKEWPELIAKVRAEIDPDIRNVASRRMFAKCGFCPHKIVNSKDTLGNEVKLQLMFKVLA
jgi:hypothetical protein